VHAENQALGVNRSSFNTVLSRA